MKLISKISKTSITYGVLLFSLVGPVLAQYEVEITQPRGGITNFGSLISKGVQAALILAALLTFAFLIWGGIQWITSGGDKQAYEAARNRITAALVGLAIVAAAWALMELIGYFFGLDILGGFSIESASDNPY